jgi:hypothetical protein
MRSSGSFSPPEATKPGQWSRFGLGYAVSKAQVRFGHGGHGGSEAICYQEKRMPLSFACNLMRQTPETRTAFYKLAGFLD